MNSQNYYNRNYPHSSNVQDNAEIENAVPFVPKDNDVAISGPYIENNLLLNLGKDAIFHMSFPDSLVERDKEIIGKIIEVARDHVMIRSNDGWYLLPMVYLNYVKFIEAPLIYKTRP